jgi:alkylation response protein AidB-like acyl-CoA dehydrogenase
MNFTFTEEQQNFREEIRNFCKSEPYGEVDPRMAPDFSPDFYRRVAAKGWLGLTFPREYGGRGYGKIEETIFHDEMASHHAPMALRAYGTTAILGGAILLKRGTEEQKRYYLPRIVRGELWIGQCFTEADAGSDLLSLKTCAAREGNHYIITGEKMFQSWAPKTQYFPQYNMRYHVLLLARTNQGAPSDKSLSLFIFDVTEPLEGVSVRPIPTLDGSRTSEVFFDNVRVPKESLIGEENQAWDYVVESGVFYWDRRPGYYIGLMSGLLRELVQYVKETKINGQLLSKNMLIRHKLAELATRIEGLRLYTYRFAWSYDKGLDLIGPGSVMKFHTDRLMIYFADTAMQILGPYGQLKRGSKYAVLRGAIEGIYIEKIMRSFVSTGPSAMRNVIAGYVLGLPNEFGLIY